MPIQTPICDFGQKAHDFKLKSTENKILSLNENGDLTYSYDSLDGQTQTLKNIFEGEHNLSKNISQSEVLDLINKLNNDDQIHGILVQLPLPSHLDEKETLETLEKKFIGMSSENLLQFLKDYENEKISEVIQPTTGSTYANKIDNTFKRINWVGQTAGEIENKIRALNPKYGAFTYLGEERIKLFSASPKKNNSSVEPGLILINEEGSLEVGCKDSGLLEIETLQMPGKRIISSKEFVRGYKSTLSKNLKFS